MFRTLSILFIFLLLNVSSVSSSNFNNGSGYAAKSVLASQSLINAMDKIDNRIYAVGEHGLILYSDDFGDSWVQAESVPYSSTLTDISCSSKKSCWVTGHDATILHSNDYGKTWKNIIDKNEVIGFVRNIQEDYVNPNLLFLGTEFGLYITVDGGNKWTRFTNNMPPVAVHFIDLQKKTNDLVMGTHGRGVIIIDDISPLREIDLTTLNKKVHFFQGKKTVMADKSDFVGSFGGETRFVGESSSSSAKIKYFLPKRHTFGKMTLEIQDSQGKIITSLNPGKSKGINIVDWGFTIRQPKVAKGKTLSRGGFTSPRVKEGTYNIIIKKGRDIFENKIELIYDSITGLSKIEKEKKHAITMELYDLTQELAYLVYELDLIISKLPTKSKV